MIITVGGIKGGAGKSTIATNLAVSFANFYKKVLLVDADDQKSAFDWATQREDAENRFPDGHIAPITTICLTGKSVHQQVMKIRDNFDVVVIDTGGRDTTSQRSALVITDKFIVPFQPRSFDIWTIRQVENLIDEVTIVNDKLKSYYLINQADCQGNDNKDSIDILSESGKLNKIPIVIGKRKSYANAAADGLGVIEVKKRDKKACDEINALHLFIYS